MVMSQSIVSTLRDYVAPLLDQGRADILDALALELPRKVSVEAKSDAVELRFTMLPQEKTNWCWAATTASVSRFFDSTSTWTQSGVAAACLARSYCPQEWPCNVPYYLDRALATTKNMRGSPAASNIEVAIVREELQLDRPVCCHVKWNGGGGHFLAIYGVDADDEDLQVADPLFGLSTLPYETFATRYRGIGTWDYTYYLKPEDE